VKVVGMEVLEMAEVEGQVVVGRGVGV
jgi:hypothetical protein